MTNFAFSYILTIKAFTFICEIDIQDFTSDEKRKTAIGCQAQELRNQLPPHLKLVSVAVNNTRKIWAENSTRFFIISVANIIRSIVIKGIHPF